MQQRRSRETGNVGFLSAVYRGLGIAAAVLLLTGQLSIAGVFLSPGTFSLSLSGPFTGYAVEGVTPSANAVLDGLDVIVALLLILNEISIVGTFITGGRFTIVVSGPPFGSQSLDAYAPQAREFFSDFRTMAERRARGHERR